MVLAMLALLAQLWMVQASARHWADMATHALLSADICTVHGQDDTGSGTQGKAQPMGGMQHCPVCSVAGTSFMASHGGSGAVPPGPQAQAPLRHDNAAAPQPSRLRPPAQGPPLVWA
ncbi:DUF2946 family protein [Alicycliphilus denitrificans]|uniref:DUF2946 family protein n=1 Tax=Alicycliphilus denitrificans TaxID=179636 RepID=UPI00384F975F